MVKRSGGARSARRHAPQVSLVFGEPVSDGCPVCVELGLAGRGGSSLDPSPDGGTPDRKARSAEDRRPPPDAGPDAR